MTSTMQKISRDTRAVVIYQHTDVDGKQQLEARSANGKLLYACRRIQALGTWMRSKKYNFYEYNALPRSTQQSLDNLRAAQTNKTPRLSNPTMAEVWPQ